MSQLMFSKDDVNQAWHHLARLLRVIVYRRKVTNNTFVACHSRYALRNRRDENITSHRNNLRKALLQQPITFRSFIFFIQDILNLNVVRLSITLKDPESDEEITYHSDERVD